MVSIISNLHTINRIWVTLALQIWIILDIYDLTLSDLRLGFEQKQSQKHRHQHTLSRLRGRGCCSIGAYCAQWGGVGDGVGSYFRGRPRDRWRRFTNSASSTIQNDPKSSSQRTKHLCRDRLVRIAFYTPTKKEKDNNQVRSTLDLFRQHLVIMFYIIPSEIDGNLVLLLVA